MEKLLPWFLLKEVPGIGNLLFKRLLDRFQSPEHVFSASRNALLEVPGMSSRLAEEIAKAERADSAAFKRELDRVRRKGFRIVTQADPDFPPLLREIADPPPYLYVSGQIAGSDRTISVVGSRNATEYGIATTRRLCQSLSELGLTVVSGMARGIDTAAHIGALMGGGATIAVLGSGLNRIYPSENRGLFHQISKKGAVISEFPLDAEPDAFHFPARNRIISGISLGTVVVEATSKSGSLITARLAAEQNREVFAVPGNIHSFKSIGTHSLIKQGAKLVEHAQDILEELSGRFVPEIKTASTAADADHFQLDPEESRVLRFVEPYPIHIDALVEKIGMDAGKLAGILLQLELKGLVEQAPGKRFFLSNGK